MPRDFSSDNGFEEFGGYMEAKVSKLEEQYAAAGCALRRTDLFMGISIYVNGLTTPSADELKRIMMVYGGVFHHYERSYTTYIIASNLPDVKVRNMNTSKIISPQWVVDCVHENRILDYTRYLLYTNQKTSQPAINFPKVEKKVQQTSIVDAPQPLKCSLNGLSEQLGTLPKHLTDNVGGKKPYDEKKTKGISVVDVNECTAKAQDSYSSSSGHARTAVDPKFLSEFYNNSRLHHIATAGADLKQYVSELRDKHDFSSGFPARNVLLNRLREEGIVTMQQQFNDRESITMHIDMDCFFVSVGLRTHPHLRGQPVAVTHSKGGSSAIEVPVHRYANRQQEMEMFAKRAEQELHNNILSDKVNQGFDGKMSLSEIASCSYEARAKGVHNGMFMGQAIKLCPNLQAIPYDFEAYKEVSYTLYNIIAQYTLNIEAVSCDEMYVDLTQVLSDLKIEPMQFVHAVRMEIRQKTACPCSAGVGANKLQARMATKRAKPDGQFQLLPTTALEYFSSIGIEELPGVGSTTAYNLRQAELITCGDLQKVSLAKIQMHVGKKFAETLYNFCRAIDTRPLVYEQIRRSVSAEVNYGIRFKEYTELENFLRQLCCEVHTRLTNIKRRCKCITLKVMVRAKNAPVETSKFMGHGFCDHTTKSVSLSEYTNDVEVITRTVLTTMKALALPPNELRGIGIQLCKLDEPSVQKESKENPIKNMFSKLVAKKQLDEVKEEKDCNEERQQVAASSPTKKLSISPKKRNTAGRQTINATNNENLKKPNFMDMLQNTASKKKSKAFDNTAQRVYSEADLPDDIDPIVFFELPPSIRAEILRGRSRLSSVPLETHSSADAVIPENANDATTIGNNKSALDESDLQPSTSKAARERQHQNPADQRLQLKRNVSASAKSNNEVKASAPPTRRRVQPPPEPVQPCQPPRLLHSLNLDNSDNLWEALSPELRDEIYEQMSSQRKEIPNAERHLYKPVQPKPIATSSAAARSPLATKSSSIRNQQQLNELLPSQQSSQSDILPMYSPFALAFLPYLNQQNNHATQKNPTEVILYWIKNYIAPSDECIDYILKKAREYIIIQDFNRLYEMLSYICKLINCYRRTNCAWHKAYITIKNTVQQELHYSASLILFLNFPLKCDKCKYL